jgi:hypothetical protein
MKTHPEPVPGDAGAHGTFGARSRSRSLQTWLNLHRSGVALASGLALAAGALAFKIGVK